MGRDTYRTMARVSDRRVLIGAASLARNRLGLPTAFLSLLHLRNSQQRKRSELFCSWLQRRSDPTVAKSQALLGCHRKGIGRRHNPLMRAAALGQYSLRAYRCTDNT